MHVSIQLEGIELVGAAALVALTGVFGWGLARFQNRWWRIRGFRHLVRLSLMTHGFTLDDVFAAFDPSCAHERRRLSELWRRDGSQDDEELAA